jgi:short-subunit dehydrogenase
MAISWSRALVTGASSGIGEALARRLAAAGADLVLVARREDRLQVLADELAAGHGRTVEVLTADLTAAAGLARVEARLRDETAPVDLLVNNAGFGTHGPFADSDVDAEEREIQLNVTALVRLTRAALGAMVPRRRGAVLNVSSLVSYQPGPDNAIYTASKAFVTSFTESIHEELRGTGVTATAVLPGFTRTEFQDTAGMHGITERLPGFVWMSAESVAAQALEATAEGKALCIPGTGYKVLGAMSDVIPRAITRRMMGWARRLQ